MSRAITRSPVPKVKKIVAAIATESAMINPRRMVLRMTCLDISACIITHFRVGRGASGLTLQSAQMPEFRPNRQPLVSPGEIDHHVADMTATLAADVTLETAQNALAGKQQWLPIDGDPALPVGHLVEMNSS